MLKTKGATQVLKSSPVSDPEDQSSPARFPDSPAGLSFNPDQSPCFEQPFQEYNDNDDGPSEYEDNDDGASCAVAASTRLWLWQRCLTEAEQLPAVLAMDLAMTVYNVVETAKIWIENDSFNKGNIQKMLMADLRRAHRGALMNPDFVMEMADKMEQKAEDDGLTKATIMGMGI